MDFEKELVMEDGHFSTNTMLGTSPGSLIELDYMSEQFFEGCSLETIDISEFFYQSPSTSSCQLDLSPLWSTLEVKNVEGSENPSQKGNQEQKQKSNFLENLSVSQSQRQNPVKVQFSGKKMVNTVDFSRLSDNHLNEGSDLSKRQWIGPRANPSPASSLIDRLIWALGYIKDRISDEEILIQLWMPVNRGSRRILTTNNQPFSLDLKCPRLTSYRDISIRYQFPTEDDSEQIVGLPGRVFIGKIPEWSPDVRFFRMEEYLRVVHAQQHDVRGTLAIPVFEQGSLSCLAVIEVVLVTQKTHYRPEIENVCKALEAVNLRSSQVSSTPNVKVCDLSYQAVLPEIFEFLRCACGAHRLPLAQTWVPCICLGKGGCRHSDDNFAYCVSTVDYACYIGDPSVQGFHEACSEHHLLKSQGVAGKAFLTNQPCFSPDVTSYSKTEYPLSHHATMFGLHAAVAIRLRSIYTGAADFVLELFLPKNCRDSEEHKKILTSLSIILQKCCRSLRVVTGTELQEGIQKIGHNHLAKASQEASCWTGQSVDAQKSDNVVSVIQKEPWEAYNKNSVGFRQHQPDSTSKGSVSFGGNSSTASNYTILNSGKTGGRKRRRTQKNITLQLLQQYFAGSLKEAAKSIGVCSTTLKKICRQHGIKRWPSRNIKKVGHSWQNFQHVMESVKGTSGIYQIESFYSNFLGAAFSNISGISQNSYLQSSDFPRPLNRQPVSGIMSPLELDAVSKSPSSSCIQGSSPSQCCSSRTQRQPNYILNVAGHQVPVFTENTGLGVSTSDAQLHLSNDRPLLLPKSKIHKSSDERPKSEGLLPIPKVQDVEKYQEESAELKSHMRKKRSVSTCKTIGHTKIYCKKF